MPRTKKKATPVAELPVRHLVKVWKGNGKLAFLSDAPQCGTGYALEATIDVGRPFRHHVPSVIGSGPSGLLIDGLDNREPWTPSKVLAAARLGLFGFVLEVAP